MGATQGQKEAARSVVITPSGKSRQFESGGRSVTFVPLSIKRRHRTKLIVPPEGEIGVKATTSMDLPLIRTLGKAFYWQKLLDQGKYPTIRDMAHALKLEQGWMAEVLRMTTLAPDIIESILEGRQPRHLNLQTLRGRHAHLPRDWQEQRVMFGYAD